MNKPKLFELVEKGDKAARDKLVQDNMKLVYSIAKRYLGCGCEMEDLVQIGSIGLIKAIDKFDTSFNVMFSTYAVPVIAGEIKRFLRDDGPIKMSRSIKDNLYKIKKAREKIEHLHQREAYIEEIIDMTGIEREDVLMALESDVEIESINKVVYSSQDTGTTLGDRIPNKVDEMDRIVNSLFLEQLLDKLEVRERKIIKLRYYENKKQTEVARIMGISQVQVSRLEKKIIMQLRGMI